MANLLTPQEVADRLNVRLSTIYKWTSSNIIPHLKLSRRLIRFDPEDLKDWLQNKTCSNSMPRCPAPSPPRKDRKRRGRAMAASGALNGIIESAKREVLG